MSLDEAMVGPGGVRAVSSRWVVTGELALTTACHLGGEASGATDMALLRDAREGVPLLPGTTLAGALRSHLGDVLGGFGGREVMEVAALFGGDRGDDAGSQSPLVVFDSFGALPKGVTIELRDAVAIDPSKGTAKDHLKYDLELLPPGTTFPLRMELLVGEKAQEERLLGQLAAALDGLADGGIALGARRSRGFGVFTTKGWRARRFDGSSARGWVEWLTSDPLRPIDPTTTSAASARAAVVAAMTRGGLRASLPAPKDQRRDVTAEVALRFSGGLLVRSPAATADAPDAIHLRSGGHAVLPGTSVAGALRTQAMRIARSIPGSREERVQEVVWALFGPLLAEGGDAKPRASKLRVGESTVTARRARATRIRVDRFTQGVAAGALFEEEPLVDAHTKLALEVRDPSDAEVGLLVLLLKDLLSGDVPLGGSVAVGRGGCSGSATLRVKEWPRAVVLTPGSSPPADDLTRVNRAITALAESLRAQQGGDTP